MSKRLSITLILLALIFGSITLYFLLGGKTPSGSPILTGSPFGTPPDGSSSSSGSNQQGNLPNINTEQLDQNGRPLSALFRLSETPIAGAISFIKNGTTHVRYVERATGHVIDVNPATLAKVKIFNVTRPHIYTAIFKQDASGFIERTLANESDTIANTSMTLIPPKSTSTDALYTAKATLLRGDVGDIGVTPDGSLIYNLKDTGGVLTSTFVGEKPKVLLTLPFTEWQILPISNTQALLGTKSSSSASGYAYILDIRTGSMQKLLGPLSGLTVLPSADGKRIAFGFTRGSDGIFSVLNLINNISTAIVPTTLPEKCAWSKKRQGVLFCGAPENGLGQDVPDLWYQGVTSYSDRIWKFNTETETSEALVDPKNGFGVEIDIINPILSKDEDYLFFTNKNDLSLWALRLLP